MGRDVLVHGEKAKPVAVLPPAALAPLATSGGVIAKDQGGRAAAELSVKERIAREVGSQLLDDDGKPKKVPVLKNGRWVMEFATAAKTSHAPVAGAAAAQQQAVGQREFSLSFEGSSNVGISLRELDGRSDSGGALPPSGFRVLVGAVKPGSHAGQAKLRPGTHTPTAARTAAASHALRCPQKKACIPGAHGRSSAPPLLFFSQASPSWPSTGSRRRT